MFVPGFLETIFLLWFWPCSPLSPGFAATVGSKLGWASCFWVHTQQLSTEPRIYLPWESGAMTVSMPIRGHTPSQCAPKNNTFSSRCRVPDLTDLRRSQFCSAHLLRQGTGVVVKVLTHMVFRQKVCQAYKFTLFLQYHLKCRFVLEPERCLGGFRSHILKTSLSGT